MANQEFDVEQFVETAPNAIVAANTKGVIVFWNHAAERKNKVFADELTILKRNWQAPKYKNITQDIRALIHKR